MQQVTVHIDGIAELMAELKQMDDKYKRGSLKRVIRAATKPLVNKMKMEAPISKGDHTGQYAHKKGNLRNSVGLKFNRNKDNPVGYVGPNRKKGFDAFYARWVILGTKEHMIPRKNKKISFKTASGKQVIVGRFLHKGSKKDDFVGKAFRASYTIVMEIMKEKSLQEIKKIWKTRKQRAA